MAISKEQQRWKGGSAEEGLADGKLTGRGRQTWDVDTDSATHSETWVLKNVREVPAVGQIHADDRNLVVARRTCRREGPTSFVVGVDYEPAPEATRAPVISWSSVANVETIDTDAKGLPIVNTSDETLDPPLARTRYDPVLTYSRAEDGGANHVALRQIDYGAHVSAEKFWGWDAGCALIQGISGEYVEPGTGKPYWWVTYRIAFRSDGWRRRVLSTGSTHYPAGSSTPQVRVGANGQPVGHARLLDRDGGKLDGADLGTFRRREHPFRQAREGKTARGIPYLQIGNTVWLLFDVYPSRSFAPLSLLGTATLQAPGPNEF